MENKIFTVKQLADRHPFLTENSLRWMLFKGEPGLEECLIRHSRRIFINEDAFMNFLIERSNQYKAVKGLSSNKSFSQSEGSE